MFHFREKKAAVEAQGVPVRIGFVGPVADPEFGMGIEVW